MQSGPAFGKLGPNRGGPVNGPAHSFLLQPGGTTPMSVEARSTAGIRRPPPNPFAHPSAAARYTRGRRYFHPAVIARVRDVLRLDSLDRGLDVGCGTGLSARALKLIARHVVAVDAAAEMIAHAPAEPGIEYRVERAERLDSCADGDFDMVTVSQVLHWVDRDGFLQEARRVLRPQGTLVVYDNLFTAQASSLPGFQDWYRKEFLARFPPPLRGRIGFDPLEIEVHGFKMVHEEWREHEMDFGASALVDYLLTQSNVIAQVEGAGQPLQGVRDWLERSVAPFFGGPGEHAFQHRSPLWILRRGLER